MIEGLKKLIEIFIQCFKNALNPQKIEEFMETEKKANELRKQRINEEYKKLKNKE